MTIKRPKPRRFDLVIKVTATPSGNPNVCPSRARVRDLGHDGIVDIIWEPEDCAISNIVWINQPTLTAPQKQNGTGPNWTASYPIPQPAGTVSNITYNYNITLVGERTHDPEIDNIRP